jgi:hypothetical protein
VGEVLATGDRALGLREWCRTTDRFRLHCRRPCASGRRAALRHSQSHWANSAEDASSAFRRSWRQAFPLPPRRSAELLQEIGHLAASGHSETRPDKKMGWPAPACRFSECSSGQPYPNEAGELHRVTHPSQHDKHHRRCSNQNGEVVREAIHDTQQPLFINVP